MHRRTMVPLSKLQARLFAAITLIALSPAAPAQSIEELKVRGDSLERELAKVNEAIAKRESQPEESAVAKPKWYVKSFGIDEVNSAGGVEPYAILLNPNEASDIKYAVIRATLYNAVGDVVSSTIGGESTVGLQYTGPLSHTEGEKRVDWGPAWYNSTGQCLKIQSLNVTFMNGKSVTFAGKNLKAALAPSLSNECRAGR